mmetsp:Transcript_22371/g.55639  ORF Transcript_22371/g.55639 Transcript_22371/m.55639 type:complete len:223 (-) Transcript_22371:474-1142(-)
MSSRRLVSASTNVGTGSWATPSIKTRSWFTTESLIEVSPVDPSLRLRAIASNSSSTITCSSLSSAIIITSSASPGRAGTRGGLVKIVRSCASELPTYLSMISGPLTTVGGRRERPAERRAARYDFPHPGGPYKSSPFTRSVPSSSSSCLGAHNGVQIRRRISSSASLNPPIPSVTSIHLSGSRERYCAAASAALSRSSNHFPRAFFFLAASSANNRGEDSAF